MKIHIEGCFPMLSLLIALIIIGSAVPAFSYEREIANLSSILAAEIVKSGKKTIAVVDFTDLQGNVNELGRFIAEEMSGNLTTASEGFDVLDRNHIKRILEEQKLSLSGLTDPSAIKKIGKLAGSDILITGTITPFGDSIRVSCKAIDTTTAKVISSARGNIAKTATIADLLNLSIGGDTVQNNRKPPVTKSTASKSDRENKKISSGKITWDFETGDLSGWKTTGNAFNTQPTYGDNPTARRRGQPSNHQGDFWIGGYENRHTAYDPPGRTQGDGPQGTLMSDSFIISSSFINFLIGGGCDMVTERVELVIEGRIVQQATGKCNETMERVSWDVSAYEGQTAQVRLIDASSGGWGHINFDDLRFE